MRAQVEGVVKDDAQLSDSSNLEKSGASIE